MNVQELRNELIRVCEENGVEICNSPVSELYNCYGIWEPDTNRILIDPGCQGNHYVQVLAHEVIHSLDPACREAPEEPEDEVRAELRAELGCKLLIGDLYFDDGYLEQLQGELDDPISVLDEIDGAEELIRYARISI